MTETPAATPDPALAATNIAVVRVGDGVLHLTSGIALPVYVDEFTSAPGQTAPVYTYTVGAGSPFGCTLSTGSTPTWLYDQEGIPLLATTGAFIGFPCYATPVGSALSALALKVAAVVSYTGIVDTTTVIPGNVASAHPTEEFPQALRQVASDGVGLWWSAASGSGEAPAGSGVFYSPFVGSTDSPGTICNVENQSCVAQNGYDMGALGWGFGNTALMYTDSSASPFPAGGLNSFATGSTPPSLPTAGVSLIPAEVMYPYLPYGFVWSSPTSVWATETADVTVNNLAQYTLSDVIWSRQPPTPAMLLQSGAVIISIAGRQEGVAGCGGFMLYATSASTLYSYNTVTDVKLVLATAPANTVFRGVAAAPYDTPPEFVVTCTAAPTSTAASTATPTRIAIPTPGTVSMRVRARGRRGDGDGPQAPTHPHSPHYFPR